MLRGSVLTVNGELVTMTVVPCETRMVISPCFLLFAVPVNVTLPEADNDPGLTETPPPPTAATEAAPLVGVGVNTTPMEAVPLIHIRSDAEPVNEALTIDTGTEAAIVCPPRVPPSYEPIAPEPAVAVHTTSPIPEEGAVHDAVGPVAPQFHLYVMGSSSA